jgi:hypothetical protein
MEGRRECSERWRGGVNLRGRGWEGGGEEGGTDGRREEETAGGDRGMGSTARDRVYTRI